MIAMRRAMLAVMAGLMTGWAVCEAEVSLLENGSFETGAGGRPAAWRLDGNGEWASSTWHSGRRSVAVKGVGKGTAMWRAENVRWKAGEVYQVRFWYRAEAGTTGGCVVSGPNFVNDDWGLRTQWTQARWAFRMPSKVPEDGYFRLGTWNVNGTVYFDDVALLPAMVIHRRFGDVELGEGERVDGTSYSFVHRLAGYGNNCARPLLAFTADYNSNRWVFGPGKYVVYRHGVAGARIKQASVAVTVNYYQRGTCVVEASSDGKSWTPIGRLDGLDSKELAVPNALLPAGEVYVRLRSPGQGEKRADSAPGAFQVNQYQFTAELDRDMGTMAGTTTFITVLERSRVVDVKVRQLTLAAGKNTAVLAVTNRTSKPVSGQAAIVVTDTAGRRQRAGVPFSVRPGATEEVSIPWEIRKPGDYQVEVEVVSADKLALRADAGALTVPDIMDSTYGYLISSDDSVDLWWCEGAWKIARDRLAPTAKRPEMMVEAARAEVEPVQLVIRPRKPLKGLKVAVSELKGEVASIPAAAVKVRQVEYVYVKRPTDRAGCEGWWPDPLPPVKGPLDAEAGQNLPLWITVHVPRTARPGVYRGRIELSAEGGWQASVPLRLRVYSFSIPRQVHLQTALGISQGNIWRYHNLTGADEALREKVWDLYMRDWRDHHISPYHFWTKPFRVEISGYEWSGGQYDSSTAHSGRQSLKVVDDNPRGNPSAAMKETVPVDPAKRYVLRWWAKTAADGQEFMVTLGQHDADGRWIPYHNIDIVRKGSTQWRQYEVTIGPGTITPKTRSVTVTLRPARWVESGETTGTTWYDDVFFAELPAGENLLRDPGFEKSPRDVKVTIDWTEWDRQARKYLDGYHFTSFRLPVMGLGGGRYPNYNKGMLGPFAFGTPEYERLMRDYLLQIQNHLEENGWLEKAYVYWYDEPGTNDYPFVVERMRLLKRLAPKLTRMLTEQPEEPLYGAVDLWCPVLHAYRPERLHARQKLGERVWWYVCCGPRAPWIGLFIDHPHTDMRAWLWATWKWQVEGCLIWTTNWWTVGSLFGAKYQNPWEDPMSYTAGSKPGAVRYWGNGDGRFLYPPNRKAWKDQQTQYIEGPVDSYRWELLRDGIEDYEYFWLLREAIARNPRSEKARRAARLLQVPESIIGDNATEYSHQPLPILEHRRRVAQALEELWR